MVQPTDNKGATVAPLTNTFKYGMPLYGLVWPEDDVFYMCGGGGDTASGIKNKLKFARSQQGIVTDQIGEHDFDKDCPTRMVLHPSKKSLVLAMSKGGITRLDLDARGKVPKVAAVTGDLKDKLDAIKQDVRALACSASGDQLALGCADGSLLVYDWPGMQLHLDLSGDKKLPTEVKEVDFSRGTGSPRTLAVVLDDGTLEIWDVEKQKQCCRISKQKGFTASRRVMMMNCDDKLTVIQMPKGLEGALFSRVRYAPGSSQHLWALMNNQTGAHVTCWAQAPDGTLKLYSQIRATPQPGTCMDISPDGSKIGVGTAEGHVVVVSISPLSVIRATAKKSPAHMIFATCITFSPSSKYVLSGSADASVRVMECGSGLPKKRRTSLAGRLLLLMFIITTLVLVCALQGIRVLKSQGYSNDDIKAWVLGALEVVKAKVLTPKANAEL